MSMVFATFEGMTSGCVFCDKPPVAAEGWGMVTMLSVLAPLLSTGEPRLLARAEGLTTARVEPPVMNPALARLPSQLQQVSAVKNPQSGSPELTWCHTSHTQHTIHTNLVMFGHHWRMVFPILVMWRHLFWTRVVDRSFCRLCLCWLQWLPRRTGPLIPGAVKMLQA